MSKPQDGVSFSVYILSLTAHRSEPATRGTFRLIFSCLTTLTTCVYTAVHLNVPKGNTSSLAQHTRKASWVVLGIIAPEFVVYAAWTQWNSARKLKAKINEIIDRDRNSTLVGQTSPERWGMTKAFYADMGGFAIDTIPRDGKEYIPGSPRLTFTPRGIHFLALNGVFPNEAKSLIKDKSKANALAKVITCMQGGWLLIQCIARLCYQMPITLLEINTVGHVLCAFMIYIFWFYKPLDINEPTVVSSEKLEELEQLCALMWMSSSRSDTRWHKVFYKSEKFKTIQK
ncbi:major facilitator superfamily protein [Rutstroemia sp. NJR-2017a BBW]|nr:major facilitator superfamily protein [Rutstroemia sp. NJR-2017a BBW]